MSAGSRSPTFALERFARALHRAPRWPARRPNRRCDTSAVPLSLTKSNLYSRVGVARRMRIAVSEIAGEVVLGMDLARLRVWRP